MQIVDIDECATNNGNCSSLATCHNVEGSYYCTCMTGYTGDGFTCTGISHLFYVSSVSTITAWAEALSCYISHRKKADFDPLGAKTPEPILMKLSMVDYVRNHTPHNNFGGGSSTWVVWAYTSLVKSPSFFSFLTPLRRW